MFVFVITKSREKQDCALSEQGRPEVGQDGRIDENPPPLSFGLCRGAGKSYERVDLGGFAVYT
jgi:hypothetical protein